MVIIINGETVDFRRMPSRLFGSWGMNASEKKWISEVQAIVKESTPISTKE